MSNLSPYDELLLSLDGSRPEAIDLFGAVDVLRDQAVSRICGTSARVTMPLTHGDILEIVLKLNGLSDEEIIAYRPKRRNALGI